MTDLIDSYRSREHLPQTIYMGLIWFTHASVPLLIYQFGIDRQRATKWDHIAWKSFSYTRSILFGTMTILWFLAYITNVEWWSWDQIYFYMWVGIQSAAIISAIWYISAFFIAACVGGRFATDFSLLLGVISYSSLSLVAVYYLYNAN